MLMLSHRPTLLLSLICLVIAFSTACSGAEINVSLAANGAVTIADSEYLDQTAGYAIDGKWVGPGDRPESNRWHAALEKSHPHWVWVRFRQPAQISRIVLHRADIVGYPTDFTAEYSNDGGRSFTTLFKVTGNRMSPQEFTVERSFDPVVTDNVRVKITRSSYEEHPNFAQLSEVEVFGIFQDRKPESQMSAAEVRLPEPRLHPTKVRNLKITETEDQVQFRSKWLRLTVSKTQPLITALCWDSLGEGKVDENLLKPGDDGGAGIRLLPVFGENKPSGLSSVEVEANLVRYTLDLTRGIKGRLEIRVDEKTVRFAVTCAAGSEMLVKEPSGLRFAFDVSKTPVAPLANPKPGRPSPLPCILHAADYGSLYLAASNGSEINLDGSPLRHLAQWNASVSSDVKQNNDRLYVMPSGVSNCEFTASVETLYPLKDLVMKDPRLRGLGRHWLNTFQYRPDIGILSNNIVSDNAVFCMHTFTDPAVFTPTLPGGIEAIQLARESLDRYFAGAPGYGVGWEDIETETYPSLIIAAWDVIRVTGDMDLLKKWLPKLEEYAANIERQDRNGNGLAESMKPGTSGEIHCPCSNWWDQINFGHEDAYSCALGYRAFNCLVDLEKLAGYPVKAKRYEQNAKRIKSAYLPNFLNPETGIIAGWKDANGILHDYWFIFVNAVAIVNGLVPDDKANDIIDRIEAKMREVGYNRFDLGLPGNLVPVRKDDYGIGALGSPQKEDGSDSFGVFENGGASACYAYYYIQALYQLGRKAEAGRILWPMMHTYAEGGFQNGVGKGGEWRHWDGSPSGYEGFLADAYLSQLALFTGYYGISFGPQGFRLEPWSPFKGKTIPLGLKYMGSTVENILTQ